MDRCRAAPTLFFAVASLAPSLVGCDGGRSPSEERNRPLATPLPSAFDHAAQKLDAGLGEAYRAIQEKRYEAARASVEAYLARAGANARRGQAEFLIGLSFHEPQLYAQAEPHFARAAELEPGYLATHYYRGYALLQIGRLADARASLEIHRKGQPDAPATLFALGLVALEEDRVEDAAREIGRAIALTELRLADPARAADAQRDLGRYLARLADARVRLDDLAGARQALERSVKLVPDIPDVWSKLHRVLVRLGDDKAADAALARYEQVAAQRAGTRR